MLLAASLFISACGQSDDPAEPDSGPIASDDQSDPGTPASDATPTDQPSTPIPPTTNSKPAVKLNAGSIEVNAGETFSVDVVLDVFPLTEGGGINIHYAPGVLQARGVTINSATWNFASKQDGIDNVNGTIANILVSSYQGVEGAATVVTVSFEAVNAGASDIVLSESDLNPFASAGAKVNPAFVSSHVTVR